MNDHEELIRELLRGDIVSHYEMSGSTWHSLPNGITRKDSKGNPIRMYIKQIEDGKLPDEMIPTIEPQLNELLSCLGNNISARFIYLHSDEDNITAMQYFIYCDNQTFNELVRITKDKD